MSNGRSLLPGPGRLARVAEHISPAPDRSDTILGGFLRRSEMISKVRTWMVPVLAGLALGCGQAAVAQHEPGWSKGPIQTTEVSGHILMLGGQGGHIAASVRHDGLVD